MPLLETKGAASAQGFGLTLGGAAPVYIEDVFSTWLYTGNSSTLTINNGIDLSTKGGLVWGKDRVNAGTSHILIDTNRWSAGNNALLYSDLTNSQQGYTQAITAFNTTGFTLGNGSGFGGNNSSGTNYVSWTFRKQPKFFDVVTWTGDGNASKTISHSLGSVPGCIIAKGTSTVDNWWVYHRSASGTPLQSYLRLNNTSAVGTGGSDAWGATSTNITVYSSLSLNDSGQTYVAYLFAHNAGGFGLTGTDNVISCGSFTADGSGNATVSLGYEPQWLMMKNISASSPWWMYDSMRGWTVDTGANLLADSSSAEGAAYRGSPNATGFTGTSLGLNNTYVYIAIRRGPMKTPTTGTSVFKPTVTAANLGVKITTGFVTDLQMANYTAGDSQNTNFADRLRGIANTNVGNPTLASSSTRAENTSVNYLYAADNTGWLQGGWSANATSVRYDFCRAPGFFDVVCYTGTSSATTQAHNLGVVPELIIIKARISATNWTVYTATTGTGKGIYLNSTSAEVTFSQWVTSTSSTTFGLGTGTNVNGSGDNYVAYLFASCPGVSKVGSYTGTGALQTINCGFTGGARFVLIKRTDSTGDWFTYDSARGISSGNDPYLLLNSTAAEVTGTNYVDTTSVGFQVTAAAPAGLNANGGTYIFLAIA